MIRFYAVHEKLIQALDGLPRDELGVSDEVREQVLFFSFLIFEGLRRTLQNLLSLFSTNFTTIHSTIQLNILRASLHLLRGGVFTHEGNIYQES